MRCNLDAQSLVRVLPLSVFDAGPLPNIGTMPHWAGMSKDVPADTPNHLVLPTEYAQTPTIFQNVGETRIAHCKIKWHETHDIYYCCPELLTHVNIYTWIFDLQDPILTNNLQTNMQICSSVCPRCDKKGLKNSGTRLLRNTLPVSCRDALPKVTNVKDSGLPWVRLGVTWASRGSFLNASDPVLAHANLIWSFFGGSQDGNGRHYNSAIYLGPGV